MFLKKKILVVVLARGGSKGIKLKNLQKVCRKSLIQHVGLFCKKLNFVDYAMVSTDNKKIAKEAIKSGFKVPFFRSKKLSGDFVRDEDVLNDVLKKVEKKEKIIFDIIVSLPPTSPFRKKKDLIKGLNLMIKDKYDSVWTISENDTKNHPYKQLLIKNKKINFFSPHGKKIFARQQLDKVYFRNGSAYIVNRKTLLKKKLITKNTGAVISKNFQISIDTKFDIKLSNYFMKKKNV